MLIRIAKDKTTKKYCQNKKRLKALIEEKKLMSSSMSNEIKLKIVIDNKEATASSNLTDENIKELYQKFKYGKQEVNGFKKSLSS